MKRASNPTTGHIPREKLTSKRHRHRNVHCSRIYNTPVMEATQMPIDRPMDKEVVVHIYNGIFLSHKTERNWVICRDVDGSRVCQTEWSHSESEKQISYIYTCMWNLEKWYIWTGLQGRSWDTDGDNKRVHTKGGKPQWGSDGGVLNWAKGLICIKWCVQNWWLI